MCTPTKCGYLSHASDLLLIVSAGGKIRDVGPRSAGLLGRQAKTLTGKPLADLLEPDERKRLARLLSRTRTTPNVWEELTFTRADGDPEALLCCFQRLKGTDSPRGGVLVTGLRIGAMASDLRAEGAAVLGHLAFQCHGPAHRLMQAVEAVLAEHPTCESAGRCRDDLDRLLDALSHSTAWPQEFPTGRPVDVIHLLEGTLRVIDGSPDFGRLKVTLRPECPTAWANVHPVGLATVALHLVANASEATAQTPSPHLYIDVNANPDRVAVEFRDNGPGLDTEDIQNAFAPCFTKGGCAARGSGLGLYTCREIVGYMGGKIHLHSHPPKGTTVVVNLPAACPPA